MSYRVVRRVPSGPTPDSIVIAAAGQTAGLLERLRKEAASKQGVTITPNTAFPEGFTLRLQDGRVTHSFTTEAITAALARLLRPQLAKLVREVLDMNKAERHIRGGEATRRKYQAEQSV